MGFEGISIGSLLVILIIVMLLFGTKRIRNIGEDLGEAVKSFRKGMQEVDNKPNDAASAPESDKHNPV